MLVTDASGLWTVLDEPSLEDFEAAENEEVHAGTRGVLVRILRVVVVLLVISALLLYFVVPFGNVFNSTTYRWLRPNAGTHTIPLAPEQPSSPKLPV